MNSSKKPAGAPKPGRPCRQDEPSTARLEVRLTPDEYELYVDVAAARGTNLTQVVREYLRRWAAGRKA
jgi:uncharacterized protein (DUF1778 family)